MILYFLQYPVINIEYGYMVKYDEYKKWINRLLLIHCTMKYSNT